MVSQGHKKTDMTMTSPKSFASRKLRRCPKCVGAERPLPPYLLSGRSSQSLQASRTSQTLRKVKAYVLPTSIQFHISTPPPPSPTNDISGGISGKQDRGSSCFFIFGPLCNCVSRLTMAVSHPTSPAAPIFHWAHFLASSYMLSSDI